MVILGIETSTPMISVAISNQNGLICETFADGRGKQVVLLAIESALQLAGLQKQDIQAIAYSRGPGAFTGLRVGLSTAKSLAYTLRVPLVGVSTLLAFARTMETNVLVAPLLDAKKSEVYGALYRPQTQEPVMEPCVLSPAQMAPNILTAAQGEPFVCLGDGAELVAPHLPTHIARFSRLSPKAFTIAQLGREAIERGEQEDILAAAPTYIRLPEAIVNTKNRTPENP